MARYLEFRLSLLFFLEGKHVMLQRGNVECSNCALGLGRSFPRELNACFQIHCLQTGPPAQSAPRLLSLTMQGRQLLCGDKCQVMAPAPSVKHSCRHLSISSSRELTFQNAQKVKSLLLFSLHEVTFSSCLERPLLAPLWLLMTGSELQMWRKSRELLQERRWRHCGS